MNSVPLVEETRAGLIENIHSGMICGVNEKLETVYHVGNQEHYTYYRSAAKPIQALPVFLLNVITKYGLTREEAALFTASHRGETCHIAALESMLKKLPVNEDELFCPYSYPLNVEPREEMLRRNKEKRKLYHNCSGKHMGFITVCRELGYPIEGYWEVDHPLQQQILNILSRLSEVPISEIKIGKDGCGVPVFAIPLKKMAMTYLKLACPDLIKDPLLQKTVTQMISIMNEHPIMVASEQFICSLLLQDQNIVAKGGAQGVYCFGLKKERLGFSLKVLNGSEEVWPIIVAAILEQIGYKNKDTINSLRALKPYIIKNDAGAEVGTVYERFLLIGAHDEPASNQEI
ncbi:asparaginase [Neobacillus ginsengisoli]|uniref:L-asparaginase II n=1 Tax=Neobacillus ginsengisoli TaxID=904295 RepID=A0ABT9Y3E5_9BACI|nr:asparaginase [Neobacillus ginsengisoli]MDQ0201717.1 L-asparaginase II [Neobacillus ginsengisoli]